MSANGASDSMITQASALRESCTSVAACAATAGSLTRTATARPAKVRNTPPSCGQMSLGELMLDLRKAHGSLIEEYIDGLADAPTGAHAVLAQPAAVAFRKDAGKLALDLVVDRL